MLLKILFFIVSNANIQFAKKKLTYRSCTLDKALSTTKQVEFIDNKKFAKVVLDKNVEDFVIHVIFLSSSLMLIYLAKKTQIIFLLTYKVKILVKYSDFSAIFSEKKALLLPKLTKLNQHTIKLQDNKQLSYGLIHSLGVIELETLKTYIKTNLANSLIWQSKLSVNASIFFV